MLDFSKYFAVLLMYFTICGCANYRDVSVDVNRGIKVGDSISVKCKLRVKQVGEGSDIRWVLVPESIHGSSYYGNDFSDEFIGKDQYDITKISKLSGFTWWYGNIESYKCYINIDIKNQSVYCDVSDLLWWNDDKCAENEYVKLNRNLTSR